MNYYIDFDNTLFNTPLLTKEMLKTIVKFISSIKNIEEKSLDEECTLMFNREHIYNIYELAKYFAKKYEINVQELINNLNNVILNCQDYVFEDSIPFLRKLKENNHKMYILSYCSDSLQYQSAKISGSGLADYFDALYITSVPKDTLDINYENGIFIDDNPSDLLGLYSKNPKEVIRLRRNGNKYSVKDIENNDIKEYEDFTKIPIL